MTTQERVDRYLKEFGLEHWKAECKLDESASVDAWVSIHHRYLTARIYFKHEDPDDDTIRHEVLHLFHAELQLFRAMAMVSVLAGPAEDSLEEVWQQGTERIVTLLERWHDKVRELLREIVDDGDVSHPCWAPIYKKIKEIT